MQKRLGVRRVLCALALATLAAGVARAQANPDFDAAPWKALGCNAEPLTFDDPRPEVNLVGDATFPAFYTARDATYLYFRYRIDNDPRSSRRGFLTSSDWTTIVQVPSGNPLQYQYQLALNGDGSQAADTVEIWANTTAENVTFDPIFTDESDTKLWSQVFDAPGVNSTPLARAALASDGSELRGTPDFFVDVAFPIQALLDNGVIASPAELDGALFFPATATSPNRHNKDYLNCRFLPESTFAFGVSLAPDTVQANTTTRVTETITVQNLGTGVLRGILLAQPALPVPLHFVEVDPDPAVPSSVITTEPLTILVPTLAAGATATIRVLYDVRPGCTDTGVSITVAASAINAEASVTATASLTVVPSVAPEVCDGVDNDCDGQIDEGGDALCDDGNPCNGIETCGGGDGCRVTPLDCEDNNVCTIESCDPTSGCVHTPREGCTGCQSDPECSDGKPCTTDTCEVATGICRNPVIPGCVACPTGTECDDGDPCSDDVCNASGVCEHSTRPGCIRCTTAGQCDDGDACTTDSCDGNVCAHAAIPGCGPCIPQPEVCTDGADNDCDGLVDCADPDCAAAPACVPPRPEDCGNCIDDDRDGLVDVEDPDCCAAPMPLAVGHLTLRSKGHGRGSRLRLQTEYAPETPPLFNPLRQDTSIVLADASGTLLCTRVAAGHWHRARRLLFRFNDRKRSFAGGLDGGDFRIVPDGSVIFSTRARSLDMREPEAGSLRLTIGVGNECSQSTVTLRPARKGLTFP